MAKKKKRKEPVNKNKDYLVEIKGILLILIAIIGFCPFGKVADVIKGFAAFLVGSWWGFLLVLVGIAGIFMIIRRKWPNFFTVKLIGLYIIIIAVLMWSHAGYIRSLASDTLDVNNFKIIENVYYISIEHDMTKEHYISFIAYITNDRCEIVKLYPEQNAEARFLRRGKGIIYAYCNKDGLIKKNT